MVIQNKIKKNGGRFIASRKVIGAPLRQALGAPLRQALGAPLRQALGAPLRQAMGAPLRQALGASLARNAKLFADVATDVATSGFIEFAQNQPKIDLLKMPFILETDPSTTTSDSSNIPHDKIDISSIIVQRTSPTITKLVISKLIAAFLTTVLIETSLGKNIDNAIKEIKEDTNTVVNETTEAIYDFMIKTASERLQEGDTTIIASLYETLGRFISPDVRKRVLENLVIDAVSYGWLAEYDALIDQWLKKIIEIKGGNLPSDKYIIDMFNIIQNKVLPVSNTIWYYTKKSDKVPESDRYEGLMKTATGVRKMLAEDTLISKIVIGLLSASELVINTRPLGDIFGDINTMLQTLIIKIKSDIANSNGNLTLHQSILVPKKHFIEDPHNIKTHVNELKELEQYLDKTKKYVQKIKQPTPITKWPANVIKAPTANVHLTEIQNMGAFDLFRGGGRKSRRRYRSRHTKSLKNVFHHKY
jgi:hypothetical protein